jgi:hypothetical protein
MSDHDSHEHAPQPANLFQVSPGALVWRNLMLAALAVLVVLNLFIHPHHPHFEAEVWPGFWAVFGLVVAVVLARIAKGAAHTFLGKREDFYSGKGD